MSIASEEEIACCRAMAALAGATAARRAPRIQSRRTNTTPARASPAADITSLREMEFTREVYGERGRKFEVVQGSCVAPPTRGGDAVLVSNGAPPPRRQTARERRVERKPPA